MHLCCRITGKNTYKAQDMKSNFCIKFLNLLTVMTILLVSSCEKDIPVYDPPPPYEPPVETPDVSGPLPDDPSEDPSDNPSTDNPAVSPEDKKAWPLDVPLIGLWNHNLRLDVSELVEELGVNCIWTSDNMSSDLEWTSSHLYRSLSVPGIDYAMAKINRVAWGWTHAGSLAHAEWAASLSLEHSGIVGLYMNDFYDEIEEGYRTKDQWREIIERTRQVNPDLPVWVPVYPHRQQQNQAYDFDFDGVIVNMFGNKPEQIASLETHIYEGLERFPDKWAVAGVYLSSGATGQERWLSHDDFRKVLTFYVKLLNEGKIHGIRLFSADQFLSKPEYIPIAKEILATINTNEQNEND